MEALLQELRHAVRRLLRSPRFTLAAVLTLALGIGGATAIYTVVHRVVLDSLPYPEADRLVRAKSAVPGQGAEEVWNLSSAQYFHFREHAASLEELGAYIPGDANVQGPETADRASMVLATSSALRLLGARAAVGRLFDEEDDRPGAAPVVVLSHSYWQRGFGGDPGIVGATLEVNETPREVVGVLAPGIRLPGEPGAAIAVDQRDLWLPWGLDPAGPFVNSHFMPVIGRLADGVTLERAREEMARLDAALPEAFPEVYSPAFMERFDFRTDLVPLREYVVGEMARSLWILFGGVALVLLVAAANVANLFLVRMEGRRRELAIRAALGAGRAATARNVFGESMVLAVAGGLLALPVGVWGVGWLVAAAPDTLPRVGEIAPGAGTFLFAGLVSLAVGVGVGLLPFLRYGETTPGSTLGGDGPATTTGPDRRRLHSGLVAAQVGLALVLVVSAGLLLESFQRLRALDPGVNPEGAVSVMVHLPPGRYGTPEERWRFHAALLERLEAMPAVVSAGVGGSIPLSGEYPCVVHAFEDAAVADRLREAQGTLCAELVPVSPGYFEALGIPLLDGRALTATDHERPETGAVVVSHAFADRYWPGEDPLGKGVLPFGVPQPGPDGTPGPRYYRVVGLVADVPVRALEGPSAAAAYYPVVPMPGQPSWWHQSFHVVVRSDRSDPAALVPAIRTAVGEVDSAVPVDRVETLRAVVDRGTERVAFSMVLLGIAAGVALLLAGLGLYGVVSYVVARRTTEIGIRAALGARPREVERLVVASSLRMVAVGLAGGTIAALALTRLMRGTLYGVDPANPRAYATAVVTLALVALLASYLPARRAARIDPMQALRAE